MLTPSEIALQLLYLIGVRSLDTEAASLNGISPTEGDINACAIATTQALQEMFALGPSALSEQRYSTVLRPPQPVTFTATQYSTTISAFATWASWMEGCTIQGGDGEDNELISATELLRPYLGSSGSVSATVYADAIKLPDWVKNTIEPVETPQVSRLQAATNREEFRFWNSPYRGDRPHMAGAAHYVNRNKTSGEPCVYFVEPRYLSTAGPLPLFMRFNPMPAQAYPVTFKVKRKPPVITGDDISNEEEESLLVTGTLVPDLAGTYALGGTDNNGTKFYLRAGTPVAVIHFDVNNAKWILSNLYGEEQFAMYTDDGDAPAGTYIPDEGFVTGTATVTASASTVITIPTDWHESILLPFAKKWFMAHPAFSNPSAAAQIMEQYRIAKAELESFTPQIGTARAHYHNG